MLAIVGGEGFLGAYLKQRLAAAKLSYVSFDKSPGEHAIYCDVCEPITLSGLEKYDTIVNLAAEHRDDVLPVTKYDEVNVDGARNICDVARHSNIGRIVFTSSVAIYGFAEPETGEHGSPNYYNDYGRTKYLAEQEYVAWQMEDPLSRSLVIVRPTVIFGPGNRGNVYNLLRQIASKRFLMIGSGKNVKSMAYVENVADFLVHTLSFGPGIHIYNYADKPDLDMRSLVSLTRTILFNKNGIGFKLPSVMGLYLGRLCDVLAKTTGKSLPISLIRVKKFIATTQFSSAVSDTSFLPNHTLLEGLEQTIRFEFLANQSSKCKDVED